MFGRLQPNQGGSVNLGLSTCEFPGAPCYVEIVRAQKDPAKRRRGMRTLVATDGSELSAIALRSVASRPWPEGSQLKVISVPKFILTKDDSYLEKHPLKECEEHALRG